MRSAQSVEMIGTTVLSSPLLPTVAAQCAAPHKLAAAVTSSQTVASLLPMRVSPLPSTKQ